MAKIKTEYVLLGLGVTGLAIWYFFIREKPLVPPPPPPPPEGYELSVRVEEA